MPRKEGDFLVEDFFLNTGGLNTSDSPFIVEAGQATGGKNYDYNKKGGIQKRQGHALINSTANGQLRAYGLGLWDKPGASREVIRAAGTKLQNFDADAATFTNLSEDTAKTSVGTATITIASPGVVTRAAHGLASNDPIVFTTSGALPTGLTAGTTYYVKTVLTSSTFTVTATIDGAVINTSGTQSGTHTLHKFNTTFLDDDNLTPVVFSMFNTATQGVLWCAGANLNRIEGVYSELRVTENGVPDPAGVLGATVSATGGTFVVGTYYYAVSLYKASTGAEGNAALDVSAVIANTTDKVTLNLSTITGVDTTKYSQLFIYRSALNGASEFTAGNLVKTVDITAGVPASYVDTGTNELDGVAVPRANSTLLDNSDLPSGTYNTLTLFKRRLVTASGSTVYLSDINKPESWPTANVITIPSGGDITGLAIISSFSPYSASQDELLCIFKQRELWVIAGDDVDTWSLKFVDNSGVASQPLVVAANGGIAWVNYRGVMMWSGTGKPSYASQQIEDKFTQDGDIDKSEYPKGFGLFAQSRNEIQWYLSSILEGEQKYVIKLDLRLTDSSSQTLAGQLVKGVFTPDILPFATYAGMSFIPSGTASEELIYLADNAGKMYNAYTTTLDNASYVDFEYITPYLNFGMPNSAKRFHKVVIWVLNTGNYNLQLDYWANYRFEDADSSSIIQAVSATPVGNSLFWDIGFWDVNYWDGPQNQIKALTYNLYSSRNNTEGDSLRLSMKQTSETEAVIIYGFSVYYSELGLRK